eukprot:CAMPEP_0119343236 /NCGR_PEP_ID=MMETSP1333-20130426/106339_1 /TAXON_ID=418940 /ORGANISM="Scyphosphaera apsteinii, Strain RCC1455" /LENGTH=211 /DNA_ID=CAMNT_0007355617 /DNA_START=42 /DNA_END=677 /DNA_ORIENTATION=-
MSETKWIEKSDIVALCKKVCITEKGVTGEEFCEMSFTLITVFDLVLGNAAGIVKGDMLGNTKTLQDNLKKSGKATPQEMISDEITNGDLNKLIKDAKTSTCALLWLSRALWFIYGLLEHLCNNPTASVKDCAQAGYDQSLRPHHNFVVRNSVSLCLKAAPERSKLIDLLGPDEPTVLNHFKDLLPHLKAIFGNNQTFLKEFKVMPKDEKPI